ncbi:hypothetical protein [Xylophilus ampelinus]|uniref:Lipoprotein n=1 Tax=Xylophilus ampelinus TaxID=54067 RepID=A0A318T0J4_9BURK|nr:hypothetical protein [Xylophilus ampelinus]MCS4509527.1 hypothetical protein [Xylophilus ampelinus]PYE78994.1 hypothetical protein DFQ15_104190 [Xylophilus ampelinus]
MHLFKISSPLFAAFALTALLAGCAQNPKTDTTSSVNVAGTPSPMPKDWVTFEIDIGAANGQRYPDSVLRVVDKSDRMGDVGLMVIGALAGSFRSPVSKEDYRGTKVQTVAHPASINKMSEMIPALTAWREAHGKQSVVYKHPVYVRLNRFGLVYRDFSQDKPAYDLYIQTAITHKLNSDGYITWAEKPVLCSTEITTGDLTLDQWAADDYALVRARGQEHIQSCVQTVRSSFDKLFAD